MYSTENNVFIECGADLNSKRFPFRRKIFIWNSELDKFRAHYKNTGIYKTAMNYINPIWTQDLRGKIIIDAEKTLKYGDFYLDFDNIIKQNEDYEKVKQDVMQAVKYLVLFLSISPDDMLFYFSGNKGIHLIVRAQSFGLEPHIALNRIYKELAEDISKYCYNETIDTSVYDNKRLIRVENSVNKKSGLYKIPLTYEEMCSLSYPQVTSLARSPRKISLKEPAFSTKGERVFKEYISKWETRVESQRVYSGKLRKLKALPPCIKAMEKNTFRETIDERNNSGTALTSFYFQQGISKEEALQRMLKWGGENCVPSLSQNDIKVIVESVYGQEYRYGCEAFRRLSGVCDKDKCPLFNKEYNQVEEESQEGEVEDA